VNPLINLYVAPPEIAAHAAALTIVIPLMAACAAMMAPNARWSWMIASVASVLAGWMALALVGEVARHGAVDYAMGGFLPPMGIALRIDALSALMLLVISFVGVMASIASGHFLKAEVRPGKHQLYQAGVLLCMSGLIGMVATGDAFNAFVMLEVSSIGTYALIATGQDRRALPAGFNYLIMGTVGATFYVFGVGLLYAATGTLNMADMARLLAPISGRPDVLAGFAFIMVGLGVKAAMFPLHGWLPAAYAHAPGAIVVFISGAATKAAFYLMVRFAFTVFGGGAATHGFAAVLAPLAAAGVVIASLQAVQQGELRRILAFSSVAQAGLLLLGLSLGTAAGLTAALLHLVAHSLLKSSLFMAAAGAAPGAVKLSDFNGAGRRAPWTMTAFAISGLSLIGAPLTMGFLSKWKLVEALLAHGWIWGVAVVAASSLAAVFYVGRMLEAIFFKPTAEGGPVVKEAPMGVRVPLWIMALLTLWFGVDAKLPLGFADEAARAAMRVVAPGATP
jgi:multicomponent Na+:H+ antiporter subunit D